MPDPSPSSSDIALGRIRGLKPFLAGRTLSALSAQVLAVAVAWQTYALTHSVTALGWLGLAQFLPMLALVFVSGHVADRYNRKRIVQICQFIEILGALAVAAATLTGQLAPWALYCLVACFGALRSFEGPCQQTFLPAIASPSQFPRAAALSASLFQTASIVGPSLGGLLYGLGADFCYLTCACGFALALVSTSLLDLGRHVANRAPVTLESVFGGIAFLRRRRDLLGAISLDLFAVLLGGATAMLPVYASDILHLGPVGLGILRASPALGALLGSLVLARYPLRRHAGPIMFASVGIFGLATILFGLSHTLIPSVVALAVLGAADVVSVVVRGALTQLATPDGMRGRVSAVNMLFIGSSNQLGEFESGMLASAIGTEAAVVTGGIGTLIVAALWIRMFPRLWSLDRLDTIRPDEP
ncbi:MFS transporter [Swaminathania salitolerans]|uniref:MFS transporter n=1 Tax=Swaminathania salitolerans TaxID=182838 RepID=A0A511BQC8_9PROT|nr:MFS transporter [Swaminathania salitolerans]GBQ11022.1 major facilitator superfamily transporter [Swaminathania salitolerans LMG 21291]GEL02272.1 MFS transporter [Swaminathania salitolerans]